MRRLAAVALLALLLAESAFAGGKHVILLIDDSKDMKGWRADLNEKLPRWLFHGPNPTDPATPRFDPAQDTLSVLYFALHNEGPADPCKSVRGDVISGETLFQAEAIDATDEESFRRSLRESLDRPCRFLGHLSPIVISPTMALPYVKDGVSREALFSRVFIAMATNDEYNFDASTPSAEMSYLVSAHKQFDVQAPDKTVELAASVTAAFNFDTRQQWSDETTDLHYRVIEAVPRGRMPDLALLFNRRIELDRVAAGPDRVLGVPKIPGTGEIRIPRTELVPLTLAWKRSSSASEPGTVDLARCEPPVCLADGSGMRIDLFDPAVNPMQQHSGEAAPGADALTFQAAFRFDTKVYDHLRLESSWHSMELTPVPPASAWLLVFPLRVDNRWLTRLWSRGDGTPPRGGLTHAEAVVRLGRFNFAAWSLTILLLVLVIARAARRSRVFTFEPEIAWESAGEVVLDFQSPGHSRVLAGSLVLRNHGKVGWLGRRLGGVEQPTREATVVLQPDVPTQLSALGFDLGGSVAIGFVDERPDLVASVQEMVSNGRQIHIFVAEEAISDFQASGAIAETVVPVRLPVTLRFAAADVGSPRFETIVCEISIDIRVKPEQARDPSVTYERAADSLDYGHDAQLSVGRFTLVSQAKRRFAQPFRGSYRAVTTCEQRPLPGSPIALAPDAVTLGWSESAQMSAVLSCTDPEVRNPDPVSHRYAFALAGGHRSEYSPDDLAFDLHRDPTRSELELFLTYTAKRVEVHWDPARKAWASRAAPDVVAVQEGRVRFAEPSRYRFGTEEATRIVLGIEIGNSAKSGKGSVALELAGELLVAPDAAAALHLHPDYEPGDILELPTDALVVAESQAPVRADVSLRSTPIAKIDGGELGPDKCTARITFAIRITPDAGPVQTRSLQVELPLHLEQSPGSNWVVIDFGTSSVAAAVGTAGQRNDHPLLDLQRVQMANKESVASLDPEGPESGTPFLPSWIVCDADERQVADAWGKSVPPGFPRHTGSDGAALVPSSPSFITLPARKLDLAERPDRVLLSLKTWLGLNARYVPLPGGKIRFLEDGKMRNESALPLDDLLEASYAALAKAYIQQHQPLGAGQVVVCHPNTFSSLHRERLRRIAWKALADPLELISPKHLHLLSESDAVAYAYCADRMRETAPSGIERVLVYDLGAGTLDVSVITIEWNADPIYPTFLNRQHLGVPIAGNYFDETLARIIHEYLSDPSVLGTTKLEYRRPVVTRERGPNGHETAARALWPAIREAKRNWKEGKDFEVVVGSSFGGSGNLGIVEFGPTWPGPDVPRATQGRACVVNKSTPEGYMLVLSIPRDHLASHPKIVQLVEFVTRDVVREALALTGLRADEINTLIVSGRGALWPGLKELVQREVPKARQAPSMPSDMMKATVARGAIARQDFVWLHGAEPESARRGRLAVVYGSEAGTRVVFEDQWDRPIKIPVGRFRVVDVALSKPDPARDLGNGSLRKHFYVGIGKREYLTQQLGGHLLRFKKEDHGEILITNEHDEQYRIGSRDTVHNAHAAWPIGHPFLSPDEEQV